MSAAELLRQLRELGVRSRVQDGELKVSAPQGVLTAELREQLKRNKSEITELLLIAGTAGQPAEGGSIPHADRRQTIPLSFAQQRIWFLEELEGGTSVYNIPWAMRLKGELNIRALQAAIDRLVVRHESQRTVFLKTAAEPEQKILERIDVPVEVVDMRGADDAAVQAQVEAWSRESFPLDKGPLLRVRLVELARDEYVLMMLIHHIISDGWSLNVLQTELFGYYLAECTGKDAEFPELPLQYADYACWQRDYMQGPELDRQLQFWEQQLRGAPPILELPTDRVRPSEQSYRGAHARRLLPADLRDALERLARSNNATLFMVLLAAFDILLARYSGQDDIVVGTPIAGRQQTELEGLMGLFLNSLVMRADLADNPSYSELLAQVQTMALDAFAHQELPFDKLVDALQCERNMSHSPVFQVQFMLQNAPVSGEELAGIELSSFGLDYGTSKFDLTLAMGQTADGLMAEIEYSTDLFDGITIERMLEQFERLLRGIVANPAARVKDLPLLGAEEQQLFDAWNDTAAEFPGVEFPADLTLQTLLEQQAADTPHAAALIFEDEQLTYDQLNSRVNQLAHWLVDAGVGPDAAIGVYMERSVEMVAALLAIIKAGGAYVPLDPDYPEQRLVHMFEDADIKLLLAQSDLVNALPVHDAQVLSVDTAWEALGEQPSTNPPQRAQPDNLAYVIFTSGSTGRPKGVMNEHHGIVNRLLWMQSEYGLGPNDRVLQKTPYSFDVSVWEFFWPLMSGATLVMARPGGHKDSAYLAEIIRKQGITTLHFVPSMLQVFLQDSHAGDCAGLRRVICSGEALSHDLQTRFFKTLPATDLHNLYGPTEAAIDVTYWACQRDSNDSSVPIGRPVANTRIYVVEPSGRIAPIGVAGELWIGGEQVARGYVNRPELTAERFIADPFTAAPGARVYRTGDLVRWRNDGTIEFLGRIDHQVKLRGFRIELGEIEAALDAQTSVEQSLVLLREDVPGNKRLVAYVTGAGDKAPDIPKLRDALKLQLPEYMVPAAFVVLQNFPLLPNGKVDRKALPEPEGRRDVHEEYTPPASEYEKILADIWTDLLRVERVGVNDNFFELGGDSILSIQIIARAARAGLHLTPKQVFQRQTIAELAEVVGTAVRVDAQQDLVTGEVPFMPVQRWFMEQDGTDRHHFNQSVLLEVNNSISPDIIQTALQEIYQHHDALRLRLRSDNGGWSQHLDAIEELPQLMQRDLSPLPAADFAQALEEQVNEVQGSIDLSSGSLLASRYFVRGGNKPSLLLLSIHHFAIDGLGWRILLEDLETAARHLLNDEAVRLPAKTSSFKAWAARLQSYANGEKLRDEIEFWQQVAESPGSLPIDRPEGINSVGSARTLQVELSERQTRQLLQDVPQAYRTRINDILLVALARAIDRWSGKRDCLIDLEGHGREELFDDLDVSRTLGWFTSVYPVKLELAADRNPGSDLKAVKEQLRGIPGNGINYGLLRYGANCPDLQTVPSAEILFNYLGQFDQTFDGAGLFALAQSSSGMDQSPRRLRSHLLDINGSILQARLRIGITYSDALHERATIQQLADWYQEELQMLIAHCLLPETYGRTPSDFPLCTLDQPTVDRFCSKDRNVLDIYPVTPMQHGMLFHSIYETKHDSYLSQVIWKLEGTMDVDAFAQAWQLIVDRHVALRTSIISTPAGEPLQVAYKRIEVSLTYADWSELTDREREQQLRGFLDQDRSQPFEFEHLPLMRLNLFRFAANAYRFVWSFHHIIIDGWSIPIVIGELMNAYQAYAQGNVPKLAEARLFGDYVTWLCNQESASIEAFWRENLAGLTASTELPAAKIPYNQALGQGEYAEINFALTEDVTDRLKEFARQHRLTLNTLAQGVWAILLSRYNADEQVVFGATTSGRPAELKNVESMVGLLINALPIATHIPSQQKTIDWLAALQEQQLTARQYEFASLVEVQGWSDVPRGIPLFNTLLVFENYPEVASLWTRSSDSLAITDMQPVEWTNYPLMAAVNVVKQFSLRLDFDRQYYDRVTIEQLGRHFLALLEGIIADADCLIGELPMLGDSERSHLLTDWNATDVDYPSDATLQSLVEAQVAATPDEEALVFETESLTYAELNARANRLAQWLLAQNVEPDDLIGVCMERSIEMVVALLGIVKAGCAYVPLDPDYPEQRLAHMLEDASIKVLLAQAKSKAVLPSHNARTLLLDEAHTELDAQSAANPPAQIQPDNLAYTIFTSGSTGRPKGVMNEHRGIVNRLLWMQSEYRLTAEDRVLQKTPFSFDVSVWEFFWPLLSGATLVVAKPGGHKDPAYLAKLINSQGITTIHFVPSMLQVFAQEPSAATCSSLRRVICSGEALPHDLQVRFYSLLPDTGLHNLYGPTEAAIDVTYWACLPESDSLVVPIGRPVANTRIYIVDSLGNPTPVGVAGELWIGGVQVARGYVNRPDLTAERFIADPFSAATNARVYKTGDLARYRTDGNIEFLGRIDHQVKLRGFRIELGEIEARVDEHEAVEQSLVMLREDNPGDQRLVAYLVASTENLDREQIEEWEAEQVSQWEDLWQDTYSSKKEVELGSDFSGWISSYTGERIPDEEMLVWIDSTAERINSLHASRILEVGSGTGLIASRVAPECDHYLATDFSGAVMETLGELKASRSDLDSLELRQSRADELTDIEPGSYDAVVVNSVAQYFPDEEYFVAVVSRAIDMVADGGHIFLGDLRDLALLEIYQSSVQFYKANDSLTVANLASRIRQRIDQEEELLIDPLLFAAIKQHNPRVTGVRFLLKRSTDLNEMSRFRYDVIIEVGGVEQPAEPEVISWSKERLTPGRLEGLLEEGVTNGLLIRGIPDARLAADAYAMERFSDAGDMEVKALRDEIAGATIPMVEPNDIFALMSKHGWDVQLLAGTLGTFDILCRPVDDATRYDGLCLVATREMRRTGYANDPLRGRLARSLEPLLRDKIKADLPEYMMPSAFIIMDEFPLTPNGKIARKKLPAPEWRPQKEYVAPRNPVEEMLAEMWSDLLRVERIGIHDDFFALGGHSLIATQVISRVRDQLETELELRKLFKFPTIAEFGACIDNADGEPVSAAIRPMPHEDGAVLSFAQQRLWFLDKLQSGSSAYNIAWPLRLAGPLDRAALAKALNNLVERHESLRTVFVTRDGEALQMVMDDVVIDLPVRDMRGARETAIGEHLTELAGHRFDLEHGPLFSARLLELGDDEHIFVIMMHHIISDAWSSEIIYRELVAFYAAAIQGREAELPDLPIQYADYAIWQRDMLDSDDFVRQLSYWKGRLADAPPRTELPADRPRPASQTYAGATISRGLSPQLSLQLRELAQQQSTTLFVLMQSIFCILLARYSGQDDIVIGTPITGRKRSELEGLIGFFLNTLALRTNLGGNPAFDTLLGQVRNNTFEAYEYQDIPFERLVDELQPVRDMSHSPIFQVMFTVISPPGNPDGFPGLNVEPVEYDYQTAKFDLMLSVMDIPDYLGISFEYNTDLFDGSTIELMHEHFVRLLEGVVADPSCRIHELPMLGHEERHKLLVDWNATGFDYPLELTVHAMFEREAAEHPDKVALWADGEELTYAELNRRANRLAAELRVAGARPGVLIGISVERSAHMIVGLLGILKSGSAYVPLDPNYPAERVALMLEDSEAAIVLSQLSVTSNLPDTGASILCLDEFDWGDSGDIGDNVVSGARETDLAYVIYTSGSTGKPKGVAVEHRNTVALIQWAGDVFTPKELAGVLASTSVCFDLSVFEIFCTLGLGGRVVLAQDALAVPELPNSVGLTLINTVPSAIAELVRIDAIPATVQTVNLAGEPLTTALADAIYATGSVVNVNDLYGPSEDTTYSTWTRREPGEVPTIGRPIHNTQAYLLDAWGHPAPVGASGELYLGGSGVTRGYLHRPELTDEKYVPDTFGQNREGRLYRTGDQARYRPDGKLEFLGRIDQQIKLRGFRIELGEIEVALDANESVDQSLVMVREDSPGDRKLIAYVSCSGDKPDAQELRSKLQADLPEYMVPAGFVILDEFPLLPNGKINRKALPAPEWRAEEDYVAARTPAEKTLAEIWASLLQLDRVGIHDNFFELGGDSILSIRIIARAAQHGLHLTPKQVFTHQTIASLAEAAGTGERIDAEQGLVTGEVPVSPIQNWFLSLDSPNPNHFNQSLMIEIDAGITPEILQAALHEIFLHHDALRLRVARDEAGWKQDLDETGALPELQLVTIADMAAEQERNGAISAAADAAQGSIDIASGCLMANTLFLTADGEPNLLSIVIHHLGVDGISWGVLLEDIETACRALGDGEPVMLPPKTTSFKAWTLKGQAYFEAGELDEELGYWQSVVADHKALPVDKPGGDNSVASSRTEIVGLDTELTRQLLQDVPAAYKTRINDVLLTALASALREWTGDDSFLIDLEGHGREELFEDMDVSRTVGWFTTKYPVRLNLASGNDAGRNLKAIKEQLRAIPNNGFGYGLLEAGTRFDGQATCKPDIVFNYLGQFDQAYSESQLLRPSAAPGGIQQAPGRIRPHLIDINSSIAGGQLQIMVSYSSGLHEEASVQKFAAAFRASLVELIQHCIAPESFGRTPSDFPLCTLDQNEVDRIAAHDRNVEDIYPATAMQHGMLFHSIYADDQNAYLSQVLWKLDGDLDEDAFAKAWQVVVDRHTSLRTGIRSAANGEPLQVAYRKVDIDMAMTDLQKLSSQQQEEQLAEFLKTDHVTRFDLDKPPLMRLNLFRFSRNEYRFVWTYHHTVIDGWSIPVVVAELLSAYLALIDGRAPQLGEARSYRGYVEWLFRQDHTRAEDFWRTALAGLSAPTALPASRVAYNPTAGQGEYRKEFFALSDEATAGLREFARIRRLTTNTLVQGIWSILLSRYSGNEQVMFGATTSGRPAELENVESIVGLLINSLPIAASVNNDAPTIEWLGEVQEQQLTARQYEFASLVEIQGWSAVPRGTPLFNTLLVFENYPAVSDEAFADSRVPSITYLQPVEWTHYPLTAAVMIGQQFVLRLDYDTQYYDQQIVAQIGRHFLTLLEGILADADRPLGELPMLEEADKRVLLSDWNATRVDYPADATLKSLLEAQAAATPDAEALVFGEVALSYAELDTRANRLAHWLIGQGAEPGDLIGVCMERSIEMVVALVGIVKAGLAYVPLDPDYPEHRLEHMLEDADIKVLLTQSNVQSVLPTHGASVLLLDEDSSELDVQPDDNPQLAVRPDSLAYVIFTSGSTGRPKGVMNEHCGIVNRLLWMQDEYGLTAADRVLQKTPFSFDVSVWEFFWPLISGATLVVAKPDGHKDPTYMAGLIEDQRITTLHFVPSMLQVFLQDSAATNCTSLQRVICSGEALSHDLQSRFYDLFDRAELHNLYGPTEAAIDVTYWACPREADASVVPIGRPVANTQIYIVDAAGNPTPIGVAGELWIGGIQVARGYVNRPELTAERFIADPFSKDPDARIYKTGDLVRYQADGAIEFLGRIDHQVKLRGFRIELGEIEASLDALPEVEQSLVLLREDTPGDKRLVAYISGTELEADVLRQALQQELPDYMVPSAFIVLEAFPLLPNGKVDRKALPQPEWHGEHEYVAPRTSTEEALAEIWQDVLNVEQVGIHDDFFELGGHSLLATRIISRVRDVLDAAPELRLLFSNPTLAGFAEHVDSHRAGVPAATLPPIKPVPHGDGAPLSFAQQRLWFLDQLEGGGASYNVPSAIRLVGELCDDSLEQALNDLVARHESLRTIFAISDVEPVQVILPELSLSLIKRDMTAASDSELADELTRISRESFDLAQGPLLRLYLIKTGADKHVVALVMHHIVSDAWSLGILFSELMAFYNARRKDRTAELPTLPVQFADYAIWQREWLSGPELDRQLEYWKTRLQGAPSAITLPVDRPRPPVQTYAGAILARMLSPDLQDKLEKLGKRHNATLFMTLLAAFNVLLARYTGEDDIVIGTPIAGRTRSEVEGLIGLFLNTLCLRTDLSANPSFSELLGQVSGNTLDAYAHQDVPFESVVEQLQPVRDMSRSPVFQVLFTLQNAPVPDKEFENLRLESVLLNQYTAKFELSLGVQETPDGLLAGFEYNTDLFDRETIERMFDHFERLLDSVVTDPEYPIAQLPLLNTDEEQRLLTDWNATGQGYPEAETLHGLFEAQVRGRPNAEALVCAGESLSYSVLDRRANQLAHRLREFGAGPDVPVALGVDRSVDMVVGVLGILKAGAAYVPLDPVYPADRIAYMLEDSQAPILVTHSTLLDEMPTGEFATVCTDQLDGEGADEPPANTGVGSGNLAYVIYTSGSTGKPKGVQLEHRSVVNFLTSMAKKPGIAAGDRLLAVTTLCFDISVLELLLPLVTGASVVVATREESVDGYALTNLLSNAGINVMQATPATWRMLLQSGWGGDGTIKVLCGGEALDRELAEDLHAQSAGVWNMYGPTETTIWSSCHLFDPDDAVISIGQPIGNTQMYVLDKQGQPVPQCVTGELYIAGDGVARGYRDRPELTAERFMANPFRPGERMYRTGDLARYLKNGDLQVLGRTDFQVKLRGFRIELGEIESALHDCKDVDQAIVLLREDSPGDQRLVAYLTYGGEDIDPNNLREQLYATLPQYMVPAGFIRLDEIPLTPNGKVDRKALPVPEWESRDAYVAPSTPTEEALAEIWADVLRLDKVGVNDNFFVLGGHSLLATQLVARIRNTLNTELPLMYIFDYASVASLATAVDAFKLAADSALLNLDDEDLEDIRI